MQQLTGLDASFLALETTSSTGHVGGLSVLDPKEAPKPLTLARLTEVLAQRLPLIPVLRRNLLNVPFGLDQPYWIDDPDFDIEYHVRELALPRPGSDAQLTEQVSRLHARPLDRSRPLWEIYLITGLAHRRAAVYTKIHHAAIDGASGTELLTVLLDLTPAGRELPPVKPWHPEKAPGWPELAARAAAKAAWRPVQTVRITNELVKVLPTLAPVVSTVVGGMLGLNRGDGEVIATMPGRPPATPFNKPITQHRRFAFRSVDLNTVKQIKNAFGVSVNDVVMAMCAGALRRWLADREALPSQPLIAMIPVSVRDPASKGALGNKVSAMLAALPTNVSEPGLRLEIPAGGGPAGPGRPDQRLRPAGPDRAGRPCRVRHRRAAPAAAVQPDHLQRPRPERPGVPVRGQADRALPGVGGHRRPGPEHHPGRLPGPAALRPGGLP
jgi:diacylglycerol O-acyltransferase